MTQIIPPRVAFLDARTGLISREWYQFFLGLNYAIGDGNSTSNLLEVQYDPIPQSMAIYDGAIDALGIMPINQTITTDDDISPLMQQQHMIDDVSPALQPNMQEEFFIPIKG